MKVVTEQVSTVPFDRFKRKVYVARGLDSRDAYTLVDKSPNPVMQVG